MGSPSNNVLKLHAISKECNEVLSCPAWEMNHPLSCESTLPALYSLMWRPQTITMPTYSLPHLIIRSLTAGRNCSHLHSVLQPVVRIVLLLTTVVNPLLRLIYKLKIIGIYMKIHIMSRVWYQL